MFLYFTFQNAIMFYHHSVIILSVNLLHVPNWLVVPVHPSCQVTQVFLTDVLFLVFLNPLTTVLHSKCSWGCNDAMWKIIAIIGWDAVLVSDQLSTKLCLLLVNCCQFYQSEINLQFLSGDSFEIWSVIGVLAHRGANVLSKISWCLAMGLHYCGQVNWIAVWGDCLTQWGWDKMAAIFQTTFWNAFSWTIMYEFRLRFHWSLFLRVQLTIFQHCFR